MKELEQSQEQETLSQEESAQSPVQTSAEKQETSTKRHPDAKWYAVRTYSGHERKVKEHIDKEVEKQGVKEKLLTV
ncbi:MAG: hypothetical protein NZM06_08880, partial [Chloroherpetonaceae bacterium]|nr:hypothetical protein [Chloroherpetonaceae bacterium]